MGFEFGKARIIAVDAVAMKGEAGWVNLGEVKAMIVVLADGTKLRSGDREAIFDMEVTPDDKEFLSALGIVRKGSDY